MDSLTLYFCPLTCARVTMVALEQARAAYEVRLVNVMAGEQRAPEFLAVNPMGRVPALAVGKRVLTENASILLYLDAAYPDAALLPRRSDPFDIAAVRTDLIWCATTLHPLVRQVRAPFHYTHGDQADVRTKGIDAAKPILEHLEARFEKADWWFGGCWSIIDTYLLWVVSGLTGAVDLAPFPAVTEHMARVLAQRNFQAMLDREVAVVATA